MRILSHDGTIDVPYDLTSIQLCGTEIVAQGSYFGSGNDNFATVAKYSTEAKAQKAMEMLRTAYTGRFVTNADISDDFNEQLKELMKGGFGTVIVNDTNDSRVEFDNLNGYFQFPKDEDVEV